MGSPVSPIVANLHMERFESLGLELFTWLTTPSHWFRYVDDTYVKIQKSEMDLSFNHLNAIDPNI